MQELGEMLRTARQEKGLTLADAEDATRIRQRYLEALEYGDEHGLPAPVYVEGFLRGYAGFLGLPQQAVLEKYRSCQHQVEGGSTGLRLPVREISMPGTFNWRRAILAGALLAALVLTGSAYLQSGSTLTSWLPAALQPPPLPSPSEERPQVSPTPAPPDTTPVAAVPTPTPESAPTPTPTATPVPVVTVEVHITSASWLRVTVDDQVAFEGTLDAGTRRAWTGKRAVAIRSGNGAGTAVTVNGVAKGSLGSPGEVVDVAWTAQ